MNEQLKKRLKSFSWRLGGMVVVAVLAFVIDNATLLEIPPYLVVILGLILGEVTKYLNKV
jgi:hypothetical protein